MYTTFKKTTVSLAVVSALSGHSVLAAAPDIDPTDYPRLTPKEVGHVRRMVDLSQQLPGEWAGMGSDFWQIGERTLQFQLSYMAMALGLVQHSYTPAYRELYRDSMHSLIQKMTLPDVWERWIFAARGGTTVDPSQPELMEGWLDPVRKYNIMLKGYLLQSGALYQMLYHDGRYAKADAFTFKFIPSTWGNGQVTFRYSLGDVAKIVYQEYVDQNYEGVLCEPNRFFPECNQPPLLGLINYDQVNGTGYAADVLPKFKEQWAEQNYTSATTGNTIAVRYIEQEFQLKTDNLPLLGAMTEGWNASWMNVWDPEFVQKHYPKWRARHLDALRSDDYARELKLEGVGARVAYGHFAFMAAEAGDMDAREKLLDHADKYFNPIWENGQYYYPRNDSYEPDENGIIRGVDTWTGNVNLALARLDKGNAFRNMYANPWTDEIRRQPYIASIDYLTTNVVQAWYDAGKKALIVTLEPGPVNAADTSFVVHNLDPQKTYEVRKDKKRVKDLTWTDGGDLVLKTTLSKPHTFIVVEAE